MVDEPVSRSEENGDRRGDAVSGEGRPGDGQAQARAVSVAPLATMPGAAYQIYPPGASLYDIFAALWRAKWFIGLFVVLAVAVAVIALHYATPKYTAKMVVAPVSNGLGTGAGPVGGAAAAVSVLGLNFLGTKAATPFEKFQATVRSVGFAKVLQQRLGLLQKIYADYWDARNRRWKPPVRKGFLRENIDRLKAYLNMPVWVEPDERLLAKYLGKIRFDPYETLPLFVISLEDKDPQFALDVLRAVYNEADAYVRTERARQVRDQLDYIRARLRSVTVGEYRQTLLAIISQKERELMILEANLPFAVEVIDPISVSAKPTSPRADIILPAVAALSFFLAIALVLIRFSLRRARLNASPPAIHRG